MFAPTAAAPAAWVAFVPWLLAVCLSPRPVWTYLFCYLLGAAYFLTHMRWMSVTTVEGYIAGSLYLGTHFILMAWPIRYLVRVRGWSPIWAAPLCIVGLEMFRSIGALGFPWFLLGHTQIALLPMIQIADLFGAFGVSFMVAMINGMVTHELRERIRRNVRTDGASTPFMKRHRQTFVGLGLIGFTLGYGLYRLNQGGGTPGPRVAVLQGDYPLSAEPDPNAPKWNEKQAFYYEQMALAAAEEPDLVVLPETPWQFIYLNRDLHALAEDPGKRKGISKDRVGWYLGAARVGRTQYGAFEEYARTHNTHLVVGSISLTPQKDGEYPDEYKYNSAYVFYPDGRDAARYDKVHLVIFGEYVPFRYTEGFHWLYQWLNSVTPWGRDGYEYSMSHGQAFETFAMQPADDAASADPARFGVTICYEDVMPQTFRGFVLDENGTKRVDFMLNISNDGWFGRTTQQSQHLVSCAFRAVENRVGIARAVNTGISGFIDSNGRWRDLVGESDRKLRPGGDGYRVARVNVDDRVTLYSRIGDVLGYGCLLGTCMAMAAAWLDRLRTRRERKRDRREAAS